MSKDILLDVLKDNKLVLYSVFFLLADVDIFWYCCFSATQTGLVVDQLHILDSECENIFSTDVSTKNINKINPMQILK